MNEIIENLDPFHAYVLVGCAFCFGVSLLGSAACAVALVLNYFKSRRD